jgi:NAD(P)-dependent dehydrogenase (short-subunit alcohol dehydrogenase family)
MSSRTALITGSSRGIGAGIATHFGALGYSVIVTYKDAKDRAEQVASSVVSGGGEADVVQLDVTVEDSVRAAFQQVAERHQTLDLLVNNAGVDWETPIEECSFDDWAQITRTRIDGNFLCTKCALPLLKESSNANIVAIASNLGERPDPRDPAYAVGTAGAVAFMRAMAIALAPHNIRSNAVGVGAVRTELRYWAEQPDPDVLWEELAAKNPLKRVTTPQDVARAVQTIVDTPFWNGNLIYVDGGEQLL